MREENERTSFPIITIGAPDRVNEYDYRERCVEKVVEIAIDIQDYMGAGRLFIPQTYLLDISNNYCGTGILPVQSWLFSRCLLDKTEQQHDTDSTETRMILQGRSSYPVKYQLRLPTWS